MTQLDDLSTIPARPWAKMLDAHRDGLEQLRLGCERFRSSVLFSASTGGFYRRNWSRSDLAPKAHPGRGGLVLARQRSWSRPDDAGGRSVTHIIWDDRPNVSLDRLMHNSAELTQAVSILTQLGETIPRDELSVMLPGALQPIVGRRGPDRWLALLHALAWGGHVPGLNATRWTWAEPTADEARERVETTGHCYSDTMRALIADGMPGTWRTIDDDSTPATDWVSELKTPIVAASLLVLRWIETTAPAPLQAPDDPRPVSDIVLTEVSANVLRFLSGQPTAKTRTYITDNLPGDRRSVSAAVDALLGHGLAIDFGGNHGVGVTDRGRAWIKAAQQTAQRTA